MNATQPTAAANAQPGFQRLKPAGSRRSGRSCPPYNPALHELIEGRKAWAEALGEEAKASGFLGWHQRGYLPHHDVPGVTQFVTFRLHDAMPASRRSEWESLLQIEDERQRRTKLEAYLDRGFGECWLGRPAIAAMAEGALRYFDAQRYQLRAWVVMPNHVHVLVEVWQTPLAKLLHNWKGFIAHEANKMIGRQGVFWEREYWDTRMQAGDQLRKAVRYIEGNPVKAGLARQLKDWPWSSARFRDEYGVLRMPTGSVAGSPPTGPLP
jgi:REP element-mobilizing transposase RayT